MLRSPFKIVRVVCIRGPQAACVRQVGPFVWEKSNLLAINMYS
jgi:hypothetical protein